MTDQIKEICPKIWEEIKKHNRFLLTFHPRPDGDSVGSVMAMKLFLEKMGKQVTVISGDDYPLQSMNFLSKYSDVKIAHFGSLNLTDFDVFLSLDSGSPDQITRKSNLSFPLPIPTIVIDHHASGTEYGETRFIDPIISSTSEILFKLMEVENSDLIDKNIANYLYVGMWSDTLGFRTASITGDTYRIVAKLIDKGAEFNKIIFNLTAIPFKNLVAMGNGLSEAKSYYNGKVIIAKIPLTAFKKLGITQDQVGETKANVAFHLSNCVGAEITVVIYEFEPNRISISMRTNNPDHFRDVSILAEALGGGGHKRAAGGKYEGNVDDAEKLFFEKLNQIYPDLCQA